MRTQKTYVKKAFDRAYEKIIEEGGSTQDAAAAAAAAAAEASTEFLEGRSGKKTEAPKRTRGQTPPPDRTASGNN